MILNTETCTQEITQILQELEPVLESGCSNCSYILRAGRSDKPGYRITRPNADTIEVEYHERTDFCRALYQICSCRKMSEQEDARYWKDFGIMLDVSRNAVPKIETMKTMIRFSALMGYTFLGLYMEDTILIPEEPYFGYMRGALSTDEIRELDQYAAVFGMELRPYIQTLAHLNQITRYQDYKECIDVNDILLIGNDRTYQLLERLIRTVSECFSSRKLNIGMDEAHMVGLGRYLDQHGYESRFSIMEKHLRQVTDLCEKYGFQVQMWSDMFFRLAFGGSYYVDEDAKLPDIQIPEGVELVYWDYFSFEQSKYEEMLRLHLKMTPEVGFAGGAWKWTGFTPHNKFSIRTSNAALKACQEYPVRSVVITAWGDDGAEASLFSILPSLFHNANLAYNKGIPEEGFELLAGIPYKDFMELDLPNPSTPDMDYTANAGKYLLYNDVLLGTFDSLCTSELPEYYRNTAELLRKSASFSEFGYLFETQALLCEVLSRKSSLGVQLKKAYDSGSVNELFRLASEEMEVLLADLECFYRAFRRQWRRENKAFGFEIQTVRLGGLRQRLLDAQEEVLSYCEGQTARIEELEEHRLPFGYGKGQDVRELEYNFWKAIVSPSVLGQIDY